jgi:hypothetical protein
MAIVITRTMVVSGWLLACALVVLLAPSATVATGLLLLSSGLALASNHVGRTVVHPLVVDRLPSWPDSGFRNIGRGTKGG